MHHLECLMPVHPASGAIHVFFLGLPRGQFRSVSLQDLLSELIHLIPGTIEILLSATSSISVSSFDFIKPLLLIIFAAKKHGYIMFHPYDGSVKSWPKSQDLPPCLFQLSATESASAVSGVPLLTMSSSVSLGTLGPQTPFQKEWDILRVWYHRIILKIHWIGWEICGDFFPIE